VSVLELTQRTSHMPVEVAVAVAALGVPTSPKAGNHYHTLAPQQVTPPSSLNISTSFLLSESDA
jgi:hypothetical protein